MKERIDQIIDEALKTEPSFQLRKDFKDRVLHVIRKQEKASQRRLYFWMALGTLVIFGFGYATVAYFMPTFLEAFKGTGEVFNQIVPIAVMLGLLISVIQYLDKKFVRNKVRFS